MTSVAETQAEPSPAAPSAAEAQPLLQVSGLAKSFGGVRALKGVDFDLRTGEVHALVGENGAGKSTLIKILSGALRPDGGTLAIDGAETVLADPREAQARGIATIYQESSLYPDLSVAENLFMGVQPRTRWGLVDWAAMERRAGEVFDRLKARLKGGDRARDLSRAQMKLVEIARALLRDARLIIMDEPTAALPSEDVDQLFAIVADLRRSGVAVIYISHRLEEVFRIADRVTVLRDGEGVGHAAIADVDQDWLITRMVGRELDRMYTTTRREPGPAILDVAGLTRDGVFEDVSFTVHAGEIVGMAGLVGSGRSEVARAVFGIDPFDAGTATLDGAPVPADPAKAIAAGLALLPEDRAGQGLILPFSVKDNISLAQLGGLSRGGVLDTARDWRLARHYIEALNIRTPGPLTAAANLSGGNQQKIVLGKWLATAPRLLILDEPTQGVDVGAKSEIHALIDSMAADGTGVLLISSELDEIVAMADRILVMHAGRLVAELPGGSTPEEVMRPAAGLAEPAHAR